MYDTAHGRNIVITMDTLLAVMALLLLCSLVISIFFRGPLERIINIIFDLQIMLHLPILEVTIPGNATTVITALLPLA